MSSKKKPAAVGTSKAMTKTAPKKTAPAPAKGKGKCSGIGVSLVSRGTSVRSALALLSLQMLWSVDTVL